MPEELKIFSGNAHLSLAREICGLIGIKLGELEVKRFSDGEINMKIKENVRGSDVFVIQPTCPPVNENLMELLIIIDALKRASVRRLTAIMPYYGYARQDRKVEPRVPITAKLVANLITTAGANRVLVMDLHAGQIQGFFDIPVDNLFSSPVLVEYFKNKKLKDLTVVSPDAGGVERARAFAKRMDASLAFIDKRRPEPNVATVMHVIGDIREKDILILDDIVDTAGTLVKSAEALAKNGARFIYAACTHPLLSGQATELIANTDCLKELIVTDTIPLEESKKNKKVVCLSIANLLGEAIKRIHREESLSSLFI